MSGEIAEISVHAITVSISVQAISISNHSFLSICVPTPHYIINRVFLLS